MYTLHVLTKRSCLKLLLLVVLSASPLAHAWDKHQVLTRAALAKEKALDRPVTVVPIEEYLTRNFGEGCTWEKAKDAVFDGVGRDFELYYQSQVPYSFRAEWDRANNILTLSPDAGFYEADLQRMGRTVSAREVLSVYSDEPDWKLDDDVKRLTSSNAIAEANSGTATRAMRHFWTPNEVFMGVDLSKGQETDQRFQLYYELALIAFDSGQDYWGYRLLGNAVHYLEDMTQPFHVLLIINTDMLDMPVAIHRLLCDVDRNLSTRFPDAGEPRCQRDETLARQIIESAWYVGTYHGLFEDFALALLETNAFAGREVVAQDSTDFQPLRWRTGQSPLLDLKSVLRQVQVQTVVQAQELGSEVFSTFGKSYVRNRQACELALTQMGQSNSPEYRMGSSYYLLDAHTVTNAQFQHRQKLIAMTQSYQRAAATWSRQLVRETTAPQSAAAKAEISRLRAKLKARCSAKTSR